MKGIPNFKFRSRDPDHAPFMGQFVLFIVLVCTCYVHTEYEDSIFNCSELIKWVPKFQSGSRDPSHPLCESIFHKQTKGFM